MANVFTADSHCKALWRFENGALTADSIGGNTLTDNNTVGTETSDYQEGSACANLEFDNSEYFSIADANLDAGFPLKNGDTTKTFSICGWFKAESFPGAGAAGIVSKYDDGADSRCFFIRCYSAFQVRIGTGTGDSSEVLYDSGSPATGVWYHFGFTYDNSTKAWQFVVWDDTASSKIVDASGTSTGNINAEDAPFAVGLNYFTSGSPVNPWDGLIDEVVVFDDVLTTDEIDAIRQGTYQIDVEVSASCEALTWTAYSAGIAVDREVMATCEALSITTHAATVTPGVWVESSSASLTLTTLEAGITYDRDVRAEAASLSISGLSAGVALHVTIPASCPALTTSGASAEVEVDVVHVNGTSASLTLTAQPAGIRHNRNVMASAAGLSAATYDAVIWDGAAWARWIARNQTRISRYYYLTLTGSADGLSDLSLPMSSFQARRRSGAPTYLSVVIPDVSYYDAIVARANGELVIDMAYVVNGVAEYQEELVSAEVENIQYHWGGRNQSLVVEGHKTETFTSKGIDLHGATYMAIDDGLHRIRCAAPEMFLSPGDTVRYGDASFDVAEMVLYVDPTLASMEVTEEA